MAQDFAALGIEVPAGFATEKTEAELFKVEPENWAAVTLFVSLASQWRIGGMGEVLGLDYVAVEAVFRIKRIQDRATLFENLQAMEWAALGIFREQQKNKNAE